MTSIITGDIMNSRKAKDQNLWLAPLKKLLGSFGETPRVWEFYRGDSFQLEIENPEDSFLRCIQVKACVRGIKGLDVRMAIGIGDKTYQAPRVSESNGPAFVHSGEMFEKLKKIKQSLALQSPWPTIDRELNLMISLASIAMDAWTPVSAEMVSLSLEHGDVSQADLGRKIGRKQSSVSERQKRAHYSEIKELEKFYRGKIAAQLGKT